MQCSGSTKIAILNENGVRTNGIMPPLVHCPRRRCQGSPAPPPRSTEPGLPCLRTAGAEVERIQGGGQGGLRAWPPRPGRGPWVSLLQVTISHHIGIAIFLVTVITRSRLISLGYTGDRSRQLLEYD
jgi:hypothetical protein